MKTDCLNPTIWTKNGKLDRDIRDSLLKVKEDVISDMNEEFEDLDSDFRLEPEKVIFTGSLTGPNYREDSDIDLHFVVDLKKYDDPILLNEFFKLYAKNFNIKVFKTAGYPIEIYFQDKDERHQAPGIYDIDKDEWIKVPDCVVVDITDKHKDKALEFLARINDFKEKWDSDLVEDVDKFLEEVGELFQEIRDYRKKGLASKEGMYSFENTVFKLLRKNKALNTIVDLMRAARAKRYAGEQEPKDEKK